MTSTREKILNTLLTKQRCTNNELANIVGINPISVRHHIDKLEASGLVTSEEERHGVGRPRLVYFLTQQGMEQFPTRYINLTIRLLKQLKENLPKQTIDNLFSRIADDLTSEYSRELNLKDLTIKERLDIIKELLNREGFNINWELVDGQYLIHEANCPYFYISQSHPEICLIDQALLSNLLSIPVKKIQCISDGDSQCTFIVNAKYVHPSESTK